MPALKTSMKIKKSFGSNLFDLLNVVFMCFVCVTVLFPMWNMLVISLSRIQDITLMNMNLFPKVVVFDAYEYIFTENRFMSALFISISRTALGTLYHILVTYLAAYALTRRKMPFLNVITVLFVITMFFSGGLIPTYIMMNSLKLTNNFLVYVLPQAFSMFTVIIVRNFLFSIDSAMEEAAFIDGASPLQTMARIMLPLSKPVLATVALWHMVQQWNSWFDNLIYNSGSPNLTTLQLMLRKIVNKPEEFANSIGRFSRDAAANLNPETVKSAIAILVILPIICVYPFLQKYFVKGIMLGSVKG